MAKQTVIKEREIVGGKWVRTEKILNDEASPDAQAFKVITLESETGDKKVHLKLDEDGVLKVSDNGNDSRMLLVGLNSQSGTVMFDGTKSMRVDFTPEFTNHPGVTVTLGDSNTSPVYRVWVGKTGFTIRFKTAYTGEVQWQAVEA